MCTPIPIRLYAYVHLFQKSHLDVQQIFKHEVRNLDIQQNQLYIQQTNLDIRQTNLDSTKLCRHATFTNNFDMYTFVVFGGRNFVKIFHYKAKIFTIAS